MGKWNVLNSFRLFDMLYQMPTFAQCICVHVIALADAATQEGEMLSRCVVSKALVCDRLMT